MISENTIINILEEQVKAYRALQDLLIKERASLVEIDPRGVEEISKQKDTVVMRLRLLEDERQRLVRQFADEKSVSGNINLDELGRQCGNEQFSKLRTQLRSLLSSIEEMNRINSVLIDRSLKYIRTTVNFFSSFSPEYEHKNTGVLLSRET